MINYNTNKLYKQPIKLHIKDLSYLSDLFNSHVDTCLSRGTIKDILHSQGGASTAINSPPSASRKRWDWIRKTDQYPFPAPFYSTNIENIARFSFVVTFV